jgi:replicative DNA helicase
MAQKRVLPHNLDAEASILGGVLLRNEVLSHLDTLDAEDFYDPRHKVVFTAVRALEAANKPIDVVTIESELDKVGKLDAIGGMAFLGELAMRVPTPDNVMHYAAIVQDKH